MFNELIEKFEEMKISMANGQDVDNAEQKLDELNRDFVLMMEEWATLLPEQQVNQSEEYLRAQMNYHYLGNQFISFIWKEDEASGNDITCAQVQPEESRLPVESQPINEALLSANDAEAGAVGGSSSKEPTEQCSNQMVVDEVPNMNSLAYIDHVRVLDPVFSLRPMANVTERGLNEIIVCITETMERAQSLSVSIQHDVIRTIVAYVQGLMDVTSQSLWLWKLDGEEPTLEDLIGFLTKRAKRILPAERATSAFFPNAATAQPSTSSASASSANAQPKSKKAKPACLRCGEQSHFLHGCPTWKKETMQSRDEFVQQNRLCLNCFSPTHTVEQCSRTFLCKTCQTKHNSLLSCSSDNSQLDRGGK